MWKDSSANVRSQYISKSKQANKSVSSGEIKRTKLHPRICCVVLHLRWEFLSTGTQENIPPQSQLLIRQRGTEAGLAERTTRNWWFSPIPFSEQQSTVSPQAKKQMSFQSVNFLNIRKALIFRLGIVTPDLYVGLTTWKLSSHPLTPNRTWQWTYFTQEHRGSSSIIPPTQVSYRETKSRGISKPPRKKIHLVLQLSIEMDN